MRYIFIAVLCFWTVRIAAAAENPAIGDLALAECYGQTKLVQIAELSSDGKRAHVQFFAPGDSANCGVVYKRDDLKSYRSVASVESEAWFGMVKSSYKLGDKIVLKSDERALGTIVDLDNNGFAGVRFDDPRTESKLGVSRFSYIDVSDLAHF